MEQALAALEAECEVAALPATDTETYTLSAEGVIGTAHLTPSP